MSDFDDYMTPSELQASQMIQQRDAKIAALTARVEELEGVLRYYATMYCEGPEGACGKLDASDCDGCRARAAITKGESND